MVRCVRCFRRPTESASRPGLIERITVDPLHRVTCSRQDLGAASGMVRDGVPVLLCRIREAAVRHPACDPEETAETARTRHCPCGATIRGGHAQGVTMNTHRQYINEQIRKEPKFAEALAKAEHEVGIAMELARLRERRGLSQTNPTASLRRTSAGFTT